MERSFHRRRRRVQLITHTRADLNADCIHEALEFLFPERNQSLVRDQRPGTVIFRMEEERDVMIQTPYRREHLGSG